MPTCLARELPTFSTLAASHHRALDASRPSWLASSTMLARVTSLAPTPPSTRERPAPRSPVIGACVTALAAVVAWGGPVVGPETRATSAWGSALAAAPKQNVPIQPALGPIRRFDDAALTPQQGTPTFDAPVSMEQFVFWLITTDGERRPIRQFAVDGETLVVWPVRSTATRSARDDVRPGGLIPPANAAAGNGAVQTPPATPLATTTPAPTPNPAPAASDPERESERLPLASCVAIVANRPVRAATIGPRAEPAMELVDGQRFPGEPRATTKPFTWLHSWLGSQPIELDRTRSIVLQPAVVAQSSLASGGSGLLEPSAEDLVLLANGDRVDGIIGDLGADVVVERAGSGETTIPIGRIAALVLISPPEPPLGPRLWFDDGTVIDAIPTSSETAKPGLVAIRRIARPSANGAGNAAPAPTTSERTPLVETVVLRAFAVEPNEILPLASVTTSEARSTGALPTFAPNRPTTVAGQWPARLAPLVIGGATAVRYELPEASGRFVAEMRPEGANPRWTSFTVVVRSGEREVFRRDVAPDPSTGALPRESVWINVPITSRTLEIEVMEGERGPICDSIRLDYAMVIRPSKARTPDTAAPRG